MLVIFVGSLIGVTGLVFWLKCVCLLCVFTPNEIHGVIVIVCSLVRSLGQILICLYISADTIFTIFYSFCLSAYLLWYHVLLVSCSALLALLFIFLLV